MTDTGNDLVWRVGRPIAPFAFLLDPKPAPSVFVVGSNDPDTDWGPFQAGAKGQASAFNGSEREIVFDLDQAEGAFELSLDFYLGWGPYPRLEIDVNGSRGLYVLDPPPLAEYSRQLTPPSPIAGYEHVVVWIAPGMLRAEGNSIKIAVAAATGPLEDVREDTEAHWAWNSAVYHCGIELRRAPAERPSRTVVLKPLPLYIRRGDELDELADLVVTAPTGFTRGSAEVEIGGVATTVPLDMVGRQFGQAVARFGFPDLDGPAQARVSVTLDGETVELATVVRPCRKWTMHVMPHVHLDMGFTDFQGKVAEVHSRNLERATAILDDFPEHAFTVDGSFGVQKFLETRSPDRAEPVLDAIREGRIGVNAFYALLVTGLCTLEEFYRALYFSAGLRRDHGLPITYANITDVPSYSWAMPSVLRAAGISRLMAVPNHGISQTNGAKVQHDVSPCWWVGPDGKRVLTFFADSYGQFAAICGFPPSVSAAERGLTALTRKFERDDCAVDQLPVFGTHGDNEDLGRGKVGDFVDRWNAEYAYPILRFSTIADYFDAIEPFGPQLPQFTGDGGSYWECAAGTAAPATAEHRRLQGDLHRAEALYALLGAVDPQLQPPRQALDRAWEGSVIACEHTWGALESMLRARSEQSVDQIEWLDDVIGGAARVATDETRRAMSQLGELVTTSETSVVAFNPHAWPVTAEVDMELAPGTEVVGPDGTPLPSAVVARVDGEDKVDYLVHRGFDLDVVRVRLLDVPAFGYRAYPLRHGPVREPVAVDRRVETVETARYAAQLDLERGMVRSLVHKGLGRELLDAGAPFALAEVVRAVGGVTEDTDDSSLRLTRMMFPDWFLPDAKPDRVGAEMTVEGVRRLPWGTSILLRGSALRAPEIRTEIVLRDDEDRVDVAVRLRTEHTRGDDSVYVAFPFAFAEPRLEYDRQQGWVDPAVDNQPGACNEWFTNQYALVLSEPGLAVTWTALDAPLFTLGDVVTGTWREEFRADNGTLFSWVVRFGGTPQMNDGEMTLRYAFEPAAQPDRARASRFGREARISPAVAQHTTRDKAMVGPRPLPGAGATLLRAEVDDNVVATMHTAVDGSGLVVRVQETAGRPGTASLAHPSGAAGSAVVCTATEDELSPLAVAGDGTVVIEVQAYSVTTVKLLRSGR
jgi:hypothetical protein